MKRSRYSESQIIKILKEGESGIPVTDICRAHGIRQLETENRRLKQMYAELSLDHKILKDIISKKL